MKIEAPTSLESLHRESPSINVCPPVDRQLSKAFHWVSSPVCWIKESPICQIDNFNCFFSFNYVTFSSFQRRHFITAMILGRYFRIERIWWRISLSLLNLSIVFKDTPKANRYQLNLLKGFAALNFQYGHKLPLSQKLRFKNYSKV